MNELNIPKNAYFFFVYKNMDAYGKYSREVLSYLEQYSDELLEIHIFDEDSEYRALRTDSDRDFTIANITDDAYTDRYGYSDAVNSFSFQPIKDIVEENGKISFTDGRGRKKIVFSSDITVNDAAELKMLLRNFFPLISVYDGYRILSIRKKDGSPL